MKRFSLAGIIGAMFLAVAASSLMPIRLLVFIVIMMLWFVAGELDRKNV